MMPIKISELWTDVASVKITAHQIYRSEFGLIEEYTPTRYGPYSSAKFHIKCINRDCRGSFDLDSIVASMCNKHEENCDGTIDGHSNEAKDSGNHCNCLLEYSILIDYNDNK